MRERGLKHMQMKVRSIYMMSIYVLSQSSDVHEMKKCVLQVLHRKRNIIYYISHLFHFL